MSDIPVNVDRPVVLPHLPTIVEGLEGSSHGPATNSGGGGRLRCEIVLVELLGTVERALDADGCYCPFSVLCYGND